MIRQLLSALRPLFSSDTGEQILDFVPVNKRVSDKWRKKKLAEAERKYGKVFRCAGPALKHEQVHRVEPPTDALKKIEAESKRQREAAKLNGQIENITRIERKR